MKRLILGPGGIFFYCILGHVYRLHLDGHLNDLEEISGASAGSLTAFLWTLGKSNIFDYVFTQDLDFKINPLQLMKKRGLVDSKRFREKLMHLCVSVFGFEDITFKEHFERTGIILHVSTFSLFKRTNVYYSVHTSPEMSVLDAITMSCAIPVYFTPFKDHVDGGLIEGIPVTPFIGREDSVYAVTMDKTYPDSHTESFGQYVYLLCSVIMNHRWTHEVQTKYLFVPSDINPVSFNIPKIDRFKLFSSGFSSAPLYTCKSSLESQCDQDPMPSEEHTLDQLHHEPQGASVVYDTEPEGNHRDDADR